MSNLTPEAKAYLDVFNQMPAIQSMDPKAVREMFAQAPPVEVELAPLAKVEDYFVPVGKGAEIKIRVYTPEGEGPFPLLIYYHGGGWVLGDIEISDASCRMMANRTSTVVVSVDYRLSPEYKFPIPLQDSYAALEWVHKNASLLNGNAYKLAVGGDSAGGNLAAVVSMMARDQQGPQISAQVLLYPVTDLGYDTASYKEFQKGFGLDKELMIWFGSHYIRDESDQKNKYAAPLLAEDLSHLPQAMIVVAECDVLRDEGLAYAKRLEEAGVTVDVICEKGLVHGYFTNMAVFSDRIKGTISKIDKFLSAANQKVKQV